ncbi:MAG: hypothetical protein ACR2J9_02425 [Gaiellales bacterium]
MALPRPLARSAGDWYRPRTMTRRTMATAVVTAAIAVLAVVGAANGQSTVCDGIADCVVAPATPVVVAVTSMPTTYEVDCPAGSTPTRHAAATQPGVLATQVPYPGTEVDPFSAAAFTPGVVATVPASPTISATSTSGDALIAGISAQRPSFYDTALNNPATGNVASVYQLSVQGDTATTGEQGAAAVPAPTGSVFVAGVPPTPQNASGRIPERYLAAGGEQWHVSFPYAWTWMTPATMTPTVGCVPTPAPRKAITHHRISGDRSVRTGTMSHWLRCPAGKVRVGDLEHAVYVTGRARLTLAERKAIDSRIVKTASGGQHVETHLGSGAPEGVRVQLHATCRG